MQKLNVTNEFSQLVKVVLGNPHSLGGVPDINETYDPKSKEHILNGTFPTEEDVIKEMDTFHDVLIKNKIEVVRPSVIQDYNQIFSRDIACVIDQKFIIANIIEEREREINAITGVIDNISEDDIIRAPEGVRFEGGDIMPHNDYLFIGYAQEPDFTNYKVARTNRNGVNFFKDLFPEKTIKAFELSKSDTDPRKNALHLDCCFQPLGLGHAIIHENGFKNNEDFHWLVDLFGKENCLLIDADQMYEMGANIFSLAPNHVISDSSFTQVNDFLRQNGYTVSEISYREIAKMEGLLRCSTLPLLRAI
ncbi:MAG: dimethylarginine dimethylaminohydrolase family protein [Flavobacteriales bacterium]